MPELPDRPDIDQLRRQARELHRVAAAGAHDALTRVRVVSGRIALSAAQLAVASEYGYPSWPALGAEVERRRARPAAVTPQVLAGDLSSAPAWFDQRYSFGGAAPIRTTAGVLSAGLLTVGSGQARLHAGLLYAEPVRPGSVGRQRWPRLDDLSATDDQGRAYVFRVESMGRHRARHGDDPGRGHVSLWCEPVPPYGTAWIELHAERISYSARRLAACHRAGQRPGSGPGKHSR